MSAGARERARCWPAPRRFGLGRWLLLAPALLCAIYLVAPLLYFWTRLSWTDVVPVLSDPRTTGAVRTSLTTSTVATTLMALFGVPLAYALARHQLPRTLHRLATLTAVLPLAFPPLISGVMLIVLFGPYGLLGSALEAHGVTVVNTSLGIVLAQVFVSAPLVILAARSAIEAVPPDYEEAAALDGATPWRAFLRITLPLASRGVAAGLLLAWMRSLGEFGATIIVAYHPFSLPVLLWVQLSASGLGMALPLVLLMFLFGLGASAFAALTRSWQPVA